MFAHCNNPSKPGPAVAGKILALLALAAACACSPDLREVTGPIIPFPNVTGQVVREGTPASDLKVKIEFVQSESLRAEDRTDGAGRFAFAGIGSPGASERTPTGKVATRRCFSR